MTQIALEQLTNEWTPFTAITTPEDNVTYNIQNRGTDILVALESSSEPTDTQEGNLVLPYKVLKYVKGTQTLYLRAFNNGCAVNVTKVD